MIGLPVAFDSQTAPGCATRAGPRGPSSVNATGRALDVAHHLQQRLPRAARRRPARGAIAEPGDDARDPLAVEVLAGDDDDAAALEVDRAGQDAAVPERVNRLAERLGRLQMLEPVDAVAVGGAERREQRIAEAADGGKLRALRGRRRASGARSMKLQVTSYKFKARENHIAAQPIGA